MTNTTTTIPPPTTAPPMMMNGDDGTRSSTIVEKNVGILAMEVYIPSVYMKQSSLEQHLGVPSGKYTIGLGQEGLAVVMGDREDINSICLTAVHNLLEKYVNEYICKHYLLSV